MKLYIFYRIYFLNFYIFDLHACSYKIFIPCIVRLKLIYPDIKEQICAKGIESKSITLEFSHQNLTSVLINHFFLSSFTCNLKNELLTIVHKYLFLNKLTNKLQLPSSFLKHFLPLAYTKIFIIS